MPFLMLVNAVRLNISCVANMATLHPFPTYGLPPLADHGFGFTLRLPQAGRFGVEVPVRARDFYLLRNIPTGSGAHWASYSMCTGLYFSRGKSDRGVKLTSHLHVVPRWNMKGVTPPLRLYVFMAWTGRSWPLAFTLRPRMTFAELTTACVPIIYHYLLCCFTSVRVRLRDSILRETEVTQNTMHNSARSCV
jgi:hypothetical protein